MEAKSAYWNNIINRLNSWGHTGACYWEWCQDELPWNSRDFCGCCRQGSEIVTATWETKFSARPWCPEQPTHGNLRSHIWKWTTLTLPESSTIKCQRYHGYYCSITHFPKFFLLQVCFFSAICSSFGWQKVKRSLLLITNVLKPHTKKSELLEDNSFGSLSWWHTDALQTVCVGQRLCVNTAQANCGVYKQRWISHVKDICTRTCSQSKGRNSSGWSNRLT
jgi:hypothetical protein